MVCCLQLTTIFTGVAIGKMLYVRSRVVTFNEIYRHGFGSSPRVWVTGNGPSKHD